MVRFGADFQRKELCPVNYVKNELVSKLFRPLNAICMRGREFRKISDGEWWVVRPLLPPMFRVGRLGLMIGWS